MVSGSRISCRWVKVLSGTALAICELLPVLVVTVVFASAVCSGASRDWEGVGVNCADSVVAFEPAEAELDDENEVAAPAPVAFAEAFDCRKMDCNLSGVVWKVGKASRITWYWLSCVYMVLIWRWPKAS